MSLQTVNHAAAIHRAEIHLNLYLFRNHLSKQSTDFQHEQSSSSLETTLSSLALLHTEARLLAALDDPNLPDTKIDFRRLEHLSRALQPCAAFLIEVQSPDVRSPLFISCTKVVAAYAALGVPSSLNITDSLLRVISLYVHDDHSPTIETISEIFMGLCAQFKVRSSNRISLTEKSISYIEPRNILKFLQKFVRVYSKEVDNIELGNILSTVDIALVSIKGLSENLEQANRSIIRAELIEIASDFNHAGVDKSIGRRLRECDVSK